MGERLTIEEIRRLGTFVSRMERRYECTSAFASKAVSLGRMRETAEIRDWLRRWRRLNDAL